MSTVGFVGYLPFAPGTFGTLAGLVVMVILRPALPLHIALSVFSIITGVISSTHAERLFNKKDPSYVVVDEFAGYIVSLLFLPLSWGYMVAAFFLFRIFDIIKPPPLRKLEYSLKGGFGIMADDIGAAVYTNLLLQAWRLIFA
ncbi:MAG: phosphatidylglycerophosphatase A [Thermodesulfovibrionales bacterium]|nr:phosphatidylglycerophosphatase A [Thermodesulfovibrionales bacterium]